MGKPDVLWKNYLGAELRIVLAIGCTMFVSLALYTSYLVPKNNPTGFNQYADQLEKANQIVASINKGHCYHSDKRKESDHVNIFQSRLPHFNENVLFLRENITYYCHNNTSFMSNVFIPERYLEPSLIKSKSGYFPTKLEQSLSNSMSIDLPAPQTLTQKFISYFV